MFSTNNELGTSFIIHLLVLSKSTKLHPHEPLKICFSKKIYPNQFKWFPIFSTNLPKIYVYVQWILYLRWWGKVIYWCTISCRCALACCTRCTGFVQQVLVFWCRGNVQCWQRRQKPVGSFPSGYHEKKIVRLTFNSYWFMQYRPCH